MLGCGSVCRGSVWDELAGNARVHLEPVRGPCLMQCHALKEFLKGKSDSERASDSGPAWMWQGEGQYGRSVRVLHPKYWMEGRLFLCQGTGSEECWCVLCHPNSALPRPSWAAEEDFPGAENIRVSLLWDDQSPRACCLQEVC